MSTKSTKAKKSSKSSKSRSQKGSRKGIKKYVIPPELFKYLERTGNLWSWRKHPWEALYVGFAHTSKSKAPREEEYLEAKREGRSPSILENARQLAEKEAKGSRKTKAGEQTSGWKTETPMKGSERTRLAQILPAAFLVFEEKVTKSTGEVYYLPLFPIVRRSSLKTGEYKPDQRGLAAALRRYKQHLAKFSKTHLDQRIAGIEKRQLS